MLRLFPVPCCQARSRRLHCLVCSACVVSCMVSPSPHFLAAFIPRKQCPPWAQCLPFSSLSLSVARAMSLKLTPFFSVCQRLTAKGHRFASPFHSLAGCLLTSIKVQCYQAWFLSQLPLPSIHILHLFLALPVVCALSEVFSQPRNCPIQVSSLSEMILILLLDYFANS